MNNEPETYKPPLSNNLAGHCCPYRGFILKDAQEIARID
jgi:hypothetical protein